MTNTLGVQMMALAEFLHLGGRSDDRGGIVGEALQIEGHGLVQHVRHAFRRDIMQIIVVHRMDGVHQGNREDAGRLQPEKAHAELVVDVDDVRLEPDQIAQAAGADGRRHTVAVNLLETVSRTAQDAVLQPMVLHSRVGGDNKDFVAKLLQTFFEEPDMSDHPVDIWKVGFGKDRNVHHSTS